MRLHLCALGVLKRGPERDLVDTYLDRATRAGRPLGLGPLSEIQIDDRKGGSPASEAALVRPRLPAGAALCAFDERGKALTSPEFAKLLAGWRDAGRGDAVFLIGGADGLDKGLRAEADARVSLGAMVWPHMLARVMVAEQLYRAVSILAGSPYHRV